MQRVTGLGGVFIKAADPEAMYAWYEKHLGIARRDDSVVVFEWRQAEEPEKKGQTIFAWFPEDTSYFDPSRSNCMLNFRVADLDAVVGALKAEGVTVDENHEDSEYGRFAWVMDPEGNRVELWEPPVNSE